MAQDKIEVKVNIHRKQEKAQQVDQAYHEITAYLSPSK